ncbi:peptide chain release factor N(5)-glutamine methyltransferase [Clostridium amazonitimonense]|uniref:peptide chain release factor N(5)-glutamine methyltransferase n=1 Tax=Clostridium amazonitimonense TaxID=1499689 RepID=UPI000509E9B3|nr:peptide chain release factor N(5)-glutamine methyltransferase [Clostridium amazonitimonense]
MKKNYTVGGQAVIEGVMMRGKEGVATAVRTPKGDIEVDIKKVSSIRDKNKILNLPFIRGFISLIESLITGIETLNYSSSFLDEEEEESRFEKLLDKWFKENSGKVVTGILLTVSFIISMFIFVFIPTAFASLFKKIGLGNMWLNIIEGVFRVGIFITYIYLISKMEDINRLFQYHGAEHKTIFCYELEQELTVENVRKQGRLHPRCGTNFLFLVMIVSIVLFSITGWNSLGERLLYRVLLLPVVSGITFEIIKWLGRSESILSQALAYPGIKLQLLTTREPDDSQLEVAIASLKAAEGIKESEKTIGELLSVGNQVLKSVNISSYILDAQLLLSKVLGVDKLYLLTHREEAVDIIKEKEFMELIEFRKNKMPIKYILGKVEFMGLELEVKEGILIPRPDTEILVESILEHIDNKGYKKICDLCTGSGAIGISLAYYNSNTNVDCMDISDVSEEMVWKNIHKFGLWQRVKFIKSDLLDEAIKEDYKYDVLVSNPPYIKTRDIEELMEDVKLFEPHLALDGGEDGLDFYRTIALQSKSILNNDGIIAFEIGHDQGEEVSGILKENGYKEIKILKDLAGLHRVVIAKNN